MVIWYLFPFIVFIYCNLSFHLHFLLFKLDNLKAQNLSCDALGLRNVNYVIVFLTYSEFISVMLWCSYLFYLSSYIYLNLRITQIHHLIYPLSSGEFYQSMHCFHSLLEFWLHSPWCFSPSLPMTILKTPKQTKSSHRFP